MKDVNVTKAISCLPEKFITMEMAEMAAAEHRAELVNYLPEPMITPKILDMIFENEYSGWESWNLSRIPEEKRNRDICLRAVKADRKNFPYVPEKYRNGDIIETLFRYGSFLDSLHIIPESSWNIQTVASGLYSLCRSIQNSRGSWKGHYTSDREGLDFIRTAKVMLSFVPPRAKGFRLWKRLIREERISIHTIDKIIPKCFKQSEYYRRWCIQSIGEVDTRWLDYDTVWKAISEKAGNIQDLIKSPRHYKWFSEHADDAMADKVAEGVPELFSRLPEKFRTEERLIRVLDGKKEINDYYFPISPELVTDKVCRALARRDSFYPDIPKEIWTKELAEYMTEHGRSFKWLSKMPKELQDRNIADRVMAEKPEYFCYLRKEFITNEMSMNLCRQNVHNVSHFKERSTEFSRYTGLPAEFYGCETELENIRERGDNRRYCRIGLTYIALQRCEKRYGEYEYYLIMTRHANRYLPARTVFRKRIDTFHRTWLEKTVCDNDPEFRMPKVEKELKDVQAMRYYDVQHIRTILGCDIYRNTFMGQTVEYCIRKNGLTYHDTKPEKLVPGLHLKIRKLKEQAALSEKTHDSKEINADMLHREMGYCLTGIEAFAEDYGLDVERSYTIGELKEAIHSRGYKPSLEKYKTEIQLLNLI